MFETKKNDSRISRQKHFFAGKFLSPGASLKHFVMRFCQTKKFFIFIILCASVIELNKKGIFVNLLLCVVIQVLVLQYEFLEDFRKALSAVETILARHIRCGWPKLHHLVEELLEVLQFVFHVEVFLVIVRFVGNLRLPVRRNLTKERKRTLMAFVLRKNSLNILPHHD